MGWESIVSDPLFRQALASEASILATIRKPEVHADGMIHFVKPPTVEPDVWGHIVGGVCGQRGDKWDMVKSVTSAKAMGTIAATGAKVFKPTAEQWEGMRDIELRFPCCEYRQPFETLIIDVPVQACITAKFGTNCGYEDYSGKELTSQVESLVITHDTANKTVYMCCINTKIGRGRPMMPMKIRIHDDDMIVEDAINSELSVEISGDAGVLPATQVKCMFRPAMNACLFLANFGMKRVGRPDEAAYELADKQSRNKKSPPDRRERNRLAARLMPEVFTIDQHIDLREATEVPREHRDSLPAGTMPPHWRRAHWAMQAHGPNHTLRKMVFRKASFVNRHKFGGDGLDSTTTYQ